jgi:hypothetical protein
MNNQRHSIRLILRARIFAVLSAGILLIPAARAQQAVESRYLLIFDTSSDMKRRVPAVQKALDNLFVTGMGGQLQRGDSIGVWTFDRDLRTDQFPLQYWMPDEAATMTAGIAAFVGKQRYAKTTSFAALQPWLTEVVTHSERLTVLIFCDGETAVSGTPYDAGINQLFKERLAGQKKARQPFVVVLRAQLGQYVGCTVDIPPALVDFPRFPPLPAPPPPPAPTNQPPPPPPPPAVVSSIIVIGTNPPPVPKPTNTPPVVPVGETNATAALPANTVVQTNAETNPPANMTNAMPSPPENPDLDSRSALAIGAVFLGAAIILGIFIRRRARKSGSSLITRSMNKE